MYYLHATVNTKRGEHDYKAEGQASVDEFLRRIIQHHPSATSVVISIVPDKDGDVTFANISGHT